MPPSETGHACAVSEYILFLPQLLTDRESNDAARDARIDELRRVTVNRAASRHKRVKSFRLIAITRLGRRSCSDRQASKV
jgi:hypothetical protein